MAFKQVTITPYPSKKPSTAKVGIVERKDSVKARVVASTKTVSQLTVNSRSAQTRELMNRRRLWGELKVCDDPFIGAILRVNITDAAFAAGVVSKSGRLSRAYT